VVRGVAVPGGLGARLSLFWGDWATFAAPPPSARLPPIVRLDLVRFGVPVVGGAVPPGVGEPTAGELVGESVAFATQRLAAPPVDPAALVASGARALTKTVLFPVRFLATVEAGLAGSNEEAVAWYVAARRPGAELARAALRWRTDPPEDPAAAAALVAAQLPVLHAEARRRLAALRAGASA
jgi:hypothetical protein